jgi:phage FluMu protein Com
MLTFLCGVCRQQLQTPDEHAGKLVQCPKCKTTLRAPAEQVASPDSATTGEAANPALPRPGPSGAKPVGGKRYGFNCQYCSSRLETTEAQAGQQGQCPTCGNDIIIPILDRYGRLIDPMTGKVIKQDPHPVHAYAAAGDRAPVVVRRPDGAQSIQCPKCKNVSPITANNCKQCGMPFTMEGTTVESVGGANGFSVASLVLGIIGLFACAIVVPSLIGLILGIVGRSHAARDNTSQGMAIAGITLSAIGLFLGVMHLARIF